MNNYVTDIKKMRYENRVKERYRSLAIVRSRPKRKRKPMEEVLLGFRILFLAQTSEAKKAEPRK